LRTSDGRTPGARVAGAARIRGPSGHACSCTVSSFIFSGVLDGSWRTSRELAKIMQSWFKIIISPHNRQRLPSFHSRVQGQLLCTRAAMWPRARSSILWSCPRTGAASWQTRSESAARTIEKPLARGFRKGVSGIMVANGSCPEQHAPHGPYRPFFHPNASFCSIGKCKRGFLVVAGRREDVRNGGGARGRKLPGRVRLNLNPFTAGGK